jgi:hypothetical protein
VLQIVHAAREARQNAGGFDGIKAFSGFFCPFWSATGPKGFGEQPVGDFVWFVALLGALAQLLKVSGG